MNGCVQIYTGHGKGKTTAALGLALRAAGAGLRTYIAQFLKRGMFSEIAVIEERIPEIRISQFGTGTFIIDEPIPEDYEEAARGFAEATEAVLSGEYDLVILDEICVAAALGLVSVDDLIELIDSRSKHVELVLTGRDAPEGLIGHADLVTVMQALKHYGDEGVEARPGIEM